MCFSSAGFMGLGGESSTDQSSQKGLELKNSRISTVLSGEDFSGQLHAGRLNRLSHTMKSMKQAKRIAINS